MPRLLHGKSLSFRPQWAGDPPAYSTSYLTSAAAAGCLLICTIFWKNKFRQDDRKKKLFEKEEAVWLVLSNTLQIKTTKKTKKHKGQPELKPLLRCSELLRPETFQLRVPLLREAQVVLARKLLSLGSFAKRSRRRKRRRKKEKKKLRRGRRVSSSEDFQSHSEGEPSCIFPCWRMLVNRIEPLHRILPTSETRLPGREVSFHLVKMPTLHIWKTTYLSPCFLFFRLCLKREHITRETNGWWCLLWRLLQRLLSKSSPNPQPYDFFYIFFSISSFLSLFSAPYEFTSKRSSSPRASLTCSGNKPGSVFSFCWVPATNSWGWKASKWNITVNFRKTLSWNHD